MKKDLPKIDKSFQVGVAGFEPTTPCSQSINQFILPILYFRFITVYQSIIFYFYCYYVFVIHLLCLYLWSEMYGKCIDNFKNQHHGLLNNHLFRPAN